MTKFQAEGKKSRARPGPRFFAGYIRNGLLVPWPPIKRLRSTFKNIPNVNVRLYGFIENDLINDSTEGFTEEMDNNLVAKASAYAGDHHLHDHERS